MNKWLPFKRETQPEAKTPARSADRPFAMLQHDINRLFDRFFDGDDWFARPFGALSDRMEGFFGDFSPKMFQPTIDLADEKTHLKLTAELPGMDAEDVKVEVKNGAVVLAGEKRAEEKTKDEHGFWRTERSFGSFQRVVPLPAEVDADHAEAEFKKGILTLRLPKLEPQKDLPKKIAVKAR